MVWWLGAVYLMFGGCGGFGGGVFFWLVFVLAMWRPCYRCFYDNFVIIDNNIVIFVFLCLK